MLTRPTPPTFLYALLLLALLATRVGGAHLHLCFDGSEPPASLHFEEAGHHDDHHADPTHDDVDVTVLAEVIAKLGKLSLDLPLLAVLLLLLVPASALRERRKPPPPIHASDPLLLLPPPRGPPLGFSP